NKNNLVKPQEIDPKKESIDGHNDVKRNQRHDFIHPKPILGDKSLDVTDPGDDDYDEVVGYVCSYDNCSYFNRNKGNVSRHISKMHLNKRPLVCGECGQPFWGRKRLFEHKKANHFGNLIYNMNRKQYKCDWHECGYQCQSVTNLKLHRRRHFGHKPFKCPVDHCLSSFVTN
ncbi:unnamed protein product, partial [Oppiella nova]